MNQITSNPAMGIARGMQINCEAAMIEMHLQAERERLYEKARQKVYGGECNAKTQCHC